MMSRIYVWSLVATWGALSALGCRSETAELSGARSDAELRAVKGDVTVISGSSSRAAYRRDRLALGDVVKIPAGGLSWMRRDGGATWLIAGPCEMELGVDTVKLDGGRAFIDTEQGKPVIAVTPHGEIELSDARASLEISTKNVSAYILRGSGRALGGVRATAGEMLTLTQKKAAKAPVVSWEDWTGGLGTADPSAAPAPFGIGTVGARPAGDQGKPRTSLVIERLQVTVTIDHDLAFTEVDQTFVNPTSETLEGIYRFRTPDDATLGQFAVDRDGQLVWGRIKESKSAEQVYQSHVYQGSTEDPALLSWESPGVYTARLYPIQAGEERRVVTRYSQWLSRQGKRGERRIYVYPMAAEGAKSSLPRIEEMTVKIDVSAAGATSIRSGMQGVREGDEIIVKAFDFTPQADLAVELFDEGRDELVGYRSPHDLLDSEIPSGRSADFANEVETTESDYVAVPLRVPGKSGAPGGFDLAIVVDTSAATESSDLAVARSLAAALLTHLGPQDRATLFAGDATLRPVFEGSDRFSEVTPSVRKRWLSGLSSAERGGATDLGALLTEAAASLDPKRNSAVIYIGDGAPSVGELAPADLRTRLARLRPGSRIIPVAVGNQANLTLLSEVARGATLHVVDDADAAARAALSILETASRGTWIGAVVDLGPGVERVLPRVLPPLAADETIMIVGRRTGKLPTEIVLKGPGIDVRSKISFERLEDRGDLRRRWGTNRLYALLEEGAGRSTLVDLSERYALVSPFTSLYVPTRSEEQAEDYVDQSKPYEDRLAKLYRWKPWARDGSTQNSPLTMSAESVAAFSPSQDGEAEQADIDREGGTGTRAKGEEGQMQKSAAGPDAAPASAKEDPHLARSAALKDARDFGLIGLLNSGAAGAPPPAPPGAEERSFAPLMKPASPEPGSRAEPARSEPTESPSFPESNATGSMFGSDRGFGAGHGRLSGQGSDKRGRRMSNGRPSAGYIGHDPVPCGAAADLPLHERRVLWRERLAGQSVSSSMSIYHQSLITCEATTWRERAVLLVMMVDQLPLVADRVSLWRSLLAISPGAADAVYRFIVLRVQSAEQLRELHEALGFAQVDPDVLKKLIAQGENARQRLTLLRGVAEKFPDDSELALRVLEAYEDAGDEAGGRSWARKLRRRPDATSHLRTSVGEYYLRLGSKDPKNGARDAAEGRRTFGEIVEFASEDPLARRHLGDLLSAHGWHEEALRQYETLARLTPDDPTVKLLLARAAHGTGKTERAVKLAEQAAATGSPDGSQPVTVAARAFSSVFLAEARMLAKKEKKDDELARLRGRASRLAAERQGSGNRVVLSWTHPELRPTLYTNALGAMMPSIENFPLLRVAEAYVAGAEGTQIEIRLDEEDAAHAARLGLSARVLLIAREGQDDETISELVIKFKDNEGSARTNVRLVFNGTALTEVVQ